MAIRCRQWAFRGARVTNGLVGGVAAKPGPSAPAKCCVASLSYTCRRAGQRRPLQRCLTTKVHCCVQGASTSTGAAETFTITTPLYYVNAGEFRCVWLDPRGRGTPGMHATQEKAPVPEVAPPPLLRSCCPCCSTSHGQCIPNHSCRCDRALSGEYLLQHGFPARVPPWLAGSEEPRGKACARPVRLPPEVAWQARAVHHWH